MKVTLAQLELRTGDLAGNTEKIIRVVQENQATSDIIVCPELSISGYNCGSLFESKEFIEDCRQHVRMVMKHVEDCTVILGAPRFAQPRLEKNGIIRLNNSAYVIQDGIADVVYDKILLANDTQHEDRKYFVAGERLMTFQVAGKMCAVLICEDIWVDDHERNLVRELKRRNPDLDTIFVINYSFFTYEKVSLREKLLAKLSKENSVNLVYLNALGIGDIVKNFMVYDGHSMVFRSDGYRSLLMPGFQEDIRTVEVSGTMPAPFINCNREKYHQIWQACLYSQRTIFAGIGIKNAQVHVSGGLDSAVVGAMVAKAMGPENTVFVSNPSDNTGTATIGHVHHLSEKLQVKEHWLHIQNVVDSFVERFTYEQLAVTPIVESTIHATGRSVFGLALTHVFQSGIVATGNQTENVLGWANFHDIGSIGVYQPFGDLTKTELYELAAFINEYYHEEIIPSRLYSGSFQPLAELPDADVDPFDYYLVSGICAEIIRKRKTRRSLMEDFDAQALTDDYFPGNKIYTYDRLVFADAVQDCWDRSRRSVYKQAQHAPVLILTPRSRGFSSREPIINHYVG